MKDKFFLITGAHGFIGAWVVKRLLAANAGKVVMFDRSADPRRLRLIMDEEEIAQTSFVAGDITSPATLPPILVQHQITHIIHLAGLQVPSCRADPPMGAMVNVIGTLNVFQAALQTDSQIKRIAYASSAAVFGKTDDNMPAIEAQAGNPGSHYGAFKRCNEDNARVYFLENGISSIGLRPLTVYGVGRDFGVTSDPTKAMKAAVVGRLFIFALEAELISYMRRIVPMRLFDPSMRKEGAFVFNLHGETAALDDIILEIEKIVPGATGTITHNETLMPIPEELDDGAIINALGALPHTPLSAGIAETIQRFQVLQQEGRLDLADLDQ